MSEDVFDAGWLDDFEFDLDGELDPELLAGDDVPPDWRAEQVWREPEVTQNVHEGYTQTTQSD